MSAPLAPELVADFMKAVRGREHDRARELLGQQPALANAHDPENFGAIPLQHATACSDRAMIDLLLDAGADIDGKSDWWAGGFSALPCNDERIAEYLVQRGATVSAYVAAGMGWLERLESVLDERPKQVNQRYGDGQTPLHVARTVEVVDLLVARGADLEARDVDHGSTPIQYQIDRPEICRRLHEHGAVPDIYTAAKLGDASIAQAVLDRSPGALSQRVGSPPFTVENSQGGHIYVYKVGAWRPMAFATREGHADLVAWMLQRASPADRLLHHAWHADRSEALALVSQHPELVGSLAVEDRALIAEAAWERRTDAVRVMLEAGFGLESAGVHDSTPLDRAAFHGFDELVELMLEKGARTDVLNEFGGTPLGACLYGAVHGWRKDGNHLRCVELLIAAGSAVNAAWLPHPDDEIDMLLRKHAPSRS